MLSTPPAFVLSQDQTLHRDLPLDPKVELQIRERVGDDSSRPAAAALSPEGFLRQPLNLLQLTVIPNDVSEMPALAFGFRSSVFKERPHTHHRSGVGARTTEPLPETGRPARKVFRPRRSCPFGLLTAGR